MARFIRGLGSLRLTIFLIIVLTLVFLFGQFFPQKSVLQGGLYSEWQQNRPELVEVLDALQLTTIYSSPITLIVWTFFFTNLALVMWRRAGIVRELVAMHPNKIRGFESVSKLKNSVVFEPGPGSRLVLLEEFFSKQRFRVLMGSEGFYAVKNRLSPVATLVFHLSFFLILAGGTLSFYTRFTGGVDLGQGEVFTGDLQQYRYPPRMPVLGDPPKLQLVVSNIEPVVIGKTPVGIEATLVDRQGREHRVGINRPFRQDGCSFVIQDLGMAPQIIITDSNGREIDGAWVKLNVVLGKTDRFEMAGLSFVVTFFPDLVMVDGEPATRSQEFNDPGLRFRVFRDDQLIGDSTLRVGESMTAGDLDLRVNDLRYWIRFYVRQESGLWLVWTGFALALAALIERLLRYRREYWVAYEVEDGNLKKVAVGGRAEFFRALFEDEFDLLMVRLQTHFGTI